MSKGKWFFKELLLIGSHRPSFFSKKRVESGLAFLIAQIGMIYFLIVNIDRMDTIDICMWASTEFAVAGYVLSHIQKEKALKEKNLEMEQESEEDK